jgi:CubicO group peptidase (beta-lactamase class C family)
MSRTPRGQLTVQQLEDRTVPATVSMSESVFDAAQFGANLHQRLEDNVVGFAYAIREHDSSDPQNTFTEVSGGWGQARMPDDTGDGMGLAMTEYMSMEVASVSKPITAVAVLKLLQDQIGTVDNYEQVLRDTLNELKMVDFLPAAWDTSGTDIANISLANLLTHTTGFTTYALTYDQARAVVEAGPSDTIAYNTVNYTIAREMMPYMLEGGAYREILDGNQPASNLPGGMQTALEALYPGTDINDLTTAQLTAGIYNYYVRTQVLEPAGVTGGDTKQPPGASTVLVYDFPYIDDVPGIDTGDQTPNAGGRGWNLSAYELQQFLTAALYDDDLLSPATREVMLEDELGWWEGDTPFGQTHGHNGGNFGNGGGDDEDGSSEHRVNTRITNFANGVNASLVINSQLGDGLPGTTTIVYDAYTAAWPVLVVEGDSGDNTFILRVSEADVNHLMELEVDGEVIMLSQDALQLLTLRGLGGNDTFQIEILPESAELILEGGTGADTFVVDANQIGGIHGAITIDGGANEDDLAVYGINGFAADTYELDGDTIDWIDYDETFAYSAVENVTLTAGTSAANSFVITGPLSASTVTVHGLSVNETFTVSGVGASTELNLYGHAGSDTFNILSSGAEVNVIGDNPGPFGWADSLNLGAGNLDTITGTVAFAGGAGQDSIVLNDTSGPIGRVLTITNSSIDPNGAAGFFSYSEVEDITYHGTPAADRLIVNSLKRESTVELFGHAGGDTFLVSNDAHNVDAVIGTVIVHGDAEPTTSPPPSARDVLAVYDDSNLNAGEYNVEAAQLIGIIEKPLGKSDPSGQPRDRVRVEYDGIENADLFAGRKDDVIEVESTPMLSALTVYTGTGQNTVRVSPTAQTLDTLLGSLSVNGGGTDTLAVDDRASAAFAPYILTSANVVRGPRVMAHTKVENIVLWVNPNGNPIAANAIAPGTTAMVFGNTGNDTLTANAPAGVAQFWGGAGLDTARLVGTAAADMFAVQGDVMRLTTGTPLVTGVLVTNNVEQREINGGGLTDTLSVQGVNGTDEVFLVEPTQIAYQGRVLIFPFSPVRYFSVEQLRVDANPADLDLLLVEGRRHNVLGTNLYDDVFNINLAAAGTSTDPVFTLRDAANVEYLRLLDFTGLSEVHFDGLGGNDTFNVTINPQQNSPGRFVYLHGSGNALAGDTVNVYYADPSYYFWTYDGFGGGTVDIDYPGQSYGLEFDGMEDWNLIPL